MLRSEECGTKPERGNPDATTALFDEIKTTLGIDFVPNMYLKLASNPAYLESTWRKVRAIMGGDTRLDARTKDLIALTVSVMSGCEYCIDVYNACARHHGLDEPTMMEIYNVIDVYSGLNRLNVAMRTPHDDRPWYGCGGGCETA